MYLSSLYGPVYLVSHIVIIYMMPELGLIIALEPGRKVRISDDKASSRNKSSALFCQSRWFNESSSIKTRYVCISDVQMKEYLNSALTLIPLLSSCPNLALSSLLFFFVVLYFSLCCVCPPRVLGSAYIYSTWRIEQMVLLFRPFCALVVLFSWSVITRMLHCVVLECLWISRWTTEKYRLKSLLLYKGDFKSSSQYCPCYNSCKCLSWWPNPNGERK